MKYNPSEIREKATKDFEKTWLETYDMVDKTGRNVFLDKEITGGSHPVPSLIHMLRDLFLSYGFKEMVNDPFVLEDDVRKQYGPESPVIADRIYYLAGLPRPDIGISKEEIRKIREISPGFDNVEGLRETLRYYRMKKISGDDFVEEMVKRAGLKPEEVTKIMYSVFPDFEGLRPVPTSLTLRSHMTANWFPILSKVQNIWELPIKLFSIDRVFRREQKVDKTHIRSHHSASMVIMNDKLSEEDGTTITMELLGNLDSLRTKLVKKDVTSKYYVPGTEYEVYAQLKDTSRPENGEWTEIANLGFYNPISLANYEIVYPVFNLGIGVERVAMLLAGGDDLRRMLYPHLFYPDSKYEGRLSDDDIARAINFTDTPKTEEGKKIRDSILQKVKEAKDAIGPTKVLVYQDDRVSVYVTEPEPGKRLLGPAGLNEIYLFNSKIIGVDPYNPKFEKVRRGGRPVASYLEGIANKVAAMAERGEKGTYSVKMAKSLSSLNLGLDEDIRKQLADGTKRIDVRGPVFLDFEIR